VIIAADEVWTPTEALCPGWVRVEDGAVAEAARGAPPAEPDLRLPIVCPGFVDIHIHGAFGRDLMDGGAACASVSAGLPRHGCTGYLPTTVSAPWQATLDAVAAFAAAVEHPPAGARPLGIHLEGPFLNPVRRGMQEPAHLRQPAPREADRLLAAGRGRVRTATIAPELPGGLELAARLAAAGVRVAMAHSDASYDEARAAAAAGVRHVTHCYNAMRPLHHREPGLVGAVLDLDELTAEVIADGVHVHPAALRLLWRVKGWRDLTLVTDAMAGAGAAEGIYRFGGQDVRVQAGEARLADGTLAGSVLTMDRAVRFMVEAGIPAREAVGMATLAPAEAAGLPRVGRIAPGCYADLVGLDAGLRVRWTMVGGAVVWRAG